MMMTLNRQSLKARIDMGERFSEFDVGFLFDNESEEFTGVERAAAIEVGIPYSFDVDVDVDEGDEDSDLDEDPEDEDEDEYEDSDENVDAGGFNYE
jgi:hypothetical protein